jgi:hypothetical protein
MKRNAYLNPLDPLAPRSWPAVADRLGRPRTHHLQQQPQGAAAGQRLGAGQQRIHCARSAGIIDHLLPLAAQCWCPF